MFNSTLKMISVTIALSVSFAPLDQVKIDKTNVNSENDSENHRRLYGSELVPVIGLNPSTESKLVPVQVVNPNLLNSNLLRSNILHSNVFHSNQLSQFSSNDLKLIHVNPVIYQNRIYQYKFYDENKQEIHDRFFLEELRRLVGSSNSHNSLSVSGGSNVLGGPDFQCSGQRLLAQNAINHMIYYHPLNKVFCDANYQVMRIHVNDINTLMENILRLNNDIIGLNHNVINNRDSLFTRFGSALKPVFGDGFGSSSLNSCFESSFLIDDEDNNEDAVVEDAASLFSSSSSQIYVKLFFLFQL